MKIKLPQIQRKSAGFICGITVLLTIVLISALIWILPHKIGTIYGEGYAIVGDKLTQRIEDNSKENLKPETISFAAGSKVYRLRNEYFINSKGRKKKINPEYPIFLNDGAYIYLFNDRFELVSDAFSFVKPRENTYLSDGLLFNANSKREGNDRILLLKLPNGFYVNVQEFKIETGNTTQSIARYSILKLGDKGLTFSCCCEKKWVFGDIKIANDLAVVSCTDKRVAYDVLYEYLNRNGKGLPDTSRDEYSINEDLYQYFLGNRYVYSGSKMCYRVKNGYIMELNGEKFLLESSPMYFAKSRKILLPADYVMVQPKLFEMNKLPAMTEVSQDANAIYTSIDKKKRSYTDLFLFDGKGTYLFFNETEISWNGKTEEIPPFSHVTVEEDGTIGIYRYDTGKYENYYADGYKQVIAVINNETKINLSADVYYRRDGQEQILFSKPSVLAEAE